MRVNNLENALKNSHGAYSWSVVLDVCAVAVLQSDLNKGFAFHFMHIFNHARPDAPVWSAVVLIE